MRNIIKKTLREQSENKNIAIVDKSDLDNKDEFGHSNWSAEYQIAKKLGKRPYKLIDNIFIPIEKGYELKDAIYLKPEQMEELNMIGQQLRDLNSNFEAKRKEHDAYTPSDKYKNYDRFRRD